MLQKKKDIFITESGVEIELLPIPPFEIQAVADALKELHPIPPVPTYEVETVGGGKELHQHTADTLSTAEDRARWEEYSAKKAVAESAINLRMNDYLFMAGTRYEMTSSDDSWMLLQKRFGVKIPDDPEELKLHYLKTRVLSPNDISELLPRLMSKTGVDQKLVETAKNSFRDSVRRTRREGPGSANDSSEGKMVHDAEIPGVKDGESVGEDPG